MDQAEAFALAALRDYASWSLIFVILTLIERISAKQPTSHAGRVAGLMFWAVWIPVSLAITTALSALWAWLGIAPLLTLDIVQALGWAGPFAVAGAVLLGLVVGDFFAYWFHRAQHAWLWRFHAVHHSITDLNAVNSYHHASEAFFNTIIVALPISLVMVNYGPTIPLIGMIIWFQASGTGCSGRPITRNRTSGRRLAWPRSLSRKACGNGSTCLSAIEPRLRLTRTWRQRARQPESAIAPDIGKSWMPREDSNLN
jgi:hypothetical protein